MRNKLLHAISNRKTFEDPIFNPDPDFIPKTVSEEEKRLRQLLCLDLETDYYVRVYLGLIQAFPDIFINANDPVQTYSPFDFPPRGVRISGGELQVSGRAMGCFTDPAPTSFPIELHYEIAYQTATTAKLTARESGKITSTQVWVSGDAPEQVLRVIWPEDWPFTGPIKLNQAWEMGASVVIDVQPSQFPWDLMAKRISGDAYLMRLLADAKLVDEFVETKDSTRKVAIAVMLLALENTSAYPEAKVEAAIQSEDHQTIETDETIIGACVGDFGEDNADELAVRNLIDSWNPRWIITTGDNWYGSSVTQESLDRRCGKYYGKWIAPYKGTYYTGPLQNMNRFWIVPGNHDRTSLGRTPIEVDFFSMPDTVYYDVLLPGGVHALMVDSGFDTGMVQRQPDGNTIDSKQAEWFRNRVRAVRSRWRLASFHHPIYTSSTGHQPTPELDWDWPSYGVKLIVNGHNHGYERLYDGIVTHCVNAAGGSDLYNFDPIPDPFSLVRYNTDHGAMRFTINSRQFLAEFINKAGQVVDRFTLK